MTRRRRFVVRYSSTVGGRDSVNIRVLMSIQSVGNWDWRAYQADAPCTSESGKRCRRSSWDQFCAVFFSFTFSCSSSFLYDANTSNTFLISFSPFSCGLYWIIYTFIHHATDFCSSWRTAACSSPSTEFEHQQERERRAILRRLRTVRIDIGKEMAVLEHFQQLVARRPHMPHRDMLHILATVEAVKEVVRTHHVTITHCQRQLQVLVDRLAARQAEGNGGNPWLADNNQRVDGWMPSEGIW